MTLDEFNATEWKSNMFIVYREMIFKVIGVNFEDNTISFIDIFDQEFCIKYNEFEMYKL